MCSTTPKTKAASPAVKTPSVIKKPPALPAIQPLQKFLVSAYDNTKATIENVPDVIAGIHLVTKKLAISIRAIFKDEHDKFYDEHAQIPYDATQDPAAPQLMHYSGSLVKVAAIYAALDLRATARQHAKTQPDFPKFPPNNAFLTSLDSIIDTSAALQRLKTFGKGLKPSLKDIFIYDASTPDKVAFKDSFKNALINIFHNEDATIVVDALGYSFINVSLMKAGYFDESTLTGIWLAGDYSKEHSLKSVRVPSVNDIVPGGSAQNITTKEMSRMFYMLHTGQAYSHVTDEIERTKANNGAHAVIKDQISWLTPAGGIPFTVPVPFTVHCTKVGIGALGPVDSPGAPVYSEGEILVWSDGSQVDAFNTKYKRKLTGEFAVCWQNLYQLDPKVNGLITVISSAIENFLTQ